MLAAYGYFVVLQFIYEKIVINNIIFLCMYVHVSGIYCYISTDLFLESGEFAYKFTISSSDKSIMFVANWIFRREFFIKYFDVIAIFIIFIARIYPICSDESNLNTSLFSKYEIDRSVHACLSPRNV